MNTAEPSLSRIGKLVLTDVSPLHFDRTGRLDLSGNLDLIELPEVLRVDRLFLRGCAHLTSLPDRLDVQLLSLADCTGITSLPTRLTWMLSTCSGRAFARSRTTFA